MSKLSPTKPDKVVKVLERLGFKRIRQSGSHAVFYHKDGRWTTVPIHKGKDVARGTLHKILKDIGISTKEFKELQ